MDPTSPAENRPLAPGAIKREWLDLLRAFPARFVIGSDQFYASPKTTLRQPESSFRPRAFLNQLPSELARKVGSENAIRIYKPPPAP